MTTADPRLADLEALYDAHHRQAIGLAYRILGDLGDAEEVVQEVFLAAWRTQHQYDASRGTSHAWILAMVRNRSIDMLRSRRRRPVQPLAEGVDPPDTLDVPAEAVSNVDAAAARVALNA
ncbi:MAG: sigma-70 family RNA polymerase sigma factor, partial [Chloroflexi bacterium]|nr:sigma-70 family RNA polymerase sigma factor [Chloroflexota bacterium]